MDGRPFPKGKEKLIMMQSNQCPESHNFITNIGNEGRQNVKDAIVN